MLRRRPRRKRHIGLRLTMAGWAFVGGSALVAATAINSGLAMLFLLFGCMVGALYISAVLSRRTIASVQVRRDAPARCRQNESVWLSYLFRAGRVGGAGLGLRVKELGSRGEALPDACCGYLPARGRRLDCTEIAPARRGRIRLRRLRLSTTFPFGLVRASRRFDQDASLLVWPGRGRLTGSILQVGQVEQSVNAPSARAGGQDEFYGLRDYRPGDNPRWIHWRRSAGRIEPVIREMSRPRPRTLWVVVDTRLSDGSPEAWSCRERAIRCAATLMEDALKAGDEVGAAMAYADGVVTIAPAARPTQRVRLLDALADIDDQTTRPLAETIGQLPRRLLRQAHVVVVAGPARAPEADRAAGRLGAACGNLTILADEGLSGEYVDDATAAEREAYPCR